ncbi:GAF domain-containing protein [Tsuneonella sp. YG55]|uniref:GAF domain-containing protein n=1 Tax=Tsuneonella litorea TaxID=2976475 RepID=A0A9X2W0K4_9SPHN|nr:adenylate/guanylate cyclase domain-containing protein [Tsuneonella litorea]MCT2557964.1 GAF domain-containing protein [Tsuneonella litorea]
MTQTGRSRGGEPAGVRLLLPRIGAALLLAAVLAGLCAPFLAAPLAQAPQARDGVIDLTGWNPRSEAIALVGEWAFRRDAGEGFDGPAPGTMRVPGTWSLGPGESTSSRGVATYRLTIRGLAPGEYAVRIPLLYSAARVYVDGKQVAGIGRLGGSPATTVQHPRAATANFASDGGPVDLAVQLASFHHRETGIVTEPVLGSPAAVAGWLTWQAAQDFVFVVSLLVLAAYGIVVFFYRGEELPALYFAASCVFFVPTAMGLAYDNLLLVAFPALGLTGMLAVQYSTLGLSVLFFLGYSHRLFPSESWRPAARTLAAGMGAIMLAQLVTIAMGDTLTASFLSLASLATAIAICVYVVTVVARAARRGRPGAGILFAGMGFFVATMAVVAFVQSDLLPRDRVVASDLAPIGILMLLFSHVVVFAMRWSLATRAAERSNVELRTLLDVSTAISTEMDLRPLLSRIVEAATRVVRADRSSLFMYDERTNELWSLVAEGIPGQQLRFPADHGIAGHCHIGGEPIVAADAYADRRFNASVDAATGYITRTVMAVPVITRDGRRLGVLQALNRVGKDGFDGRDVRRMEAFASQAAIAIENAQLFAEVDSERGYNESILASMSSGLLTLDGNGRIVKVNTAACDILGYARDAIEGARPADTFARENPGLLDEIGKVASEGSARNLVDFDVVTGRGDHISANIGIVPLRGEAGAAGVLVLFDNITATKRLQGAIGRFLPQGAVEEILERDENLLFGTSCRATVLFADIRNFTGAAEALSPRQTVDMLNDVFTSLFEAVASNDGVLDKFIGDALMAVYGAPIATGADAENAVRSALRMQELLAEYNRSRADDALPPLALGIGIATGEVIAGTIGSPKRMDYTVIGDSVNLASRLEAITKAYQVHTIVCADTATELGPAIGLRELDLVRVRGRNQPTRIYEAFPASDAGARASLLHTYAKARALLAERDWTAAARTFETALEIAPDDHPSALMRDRARALAADPPGRDWDGVWAD